MSRPRFTRAFVALASAFSSTLACNRVPEAALRDEQARSRHYRDAYETQAGEVQDLRKRIAAAEKRAAACPASLPAASEGAAPAQNAAPALTPAQGTPAVK